jgi:cytochrome c556
MHRFAADTQVAAMIHAELAAIVIVGSLALGGSCIIAVEPSAARQDIRLSAELLDLLRAEMREIATGTQSVALALASADWKSVEDTSGKIRASYIMEKKLTTAQVQQLERALPAAFKQLDQEFHLRAQKLGAAAATRDPELVGFHFSRLIENCVACHAAYARTRFPGFLPAKRAAHAH